jgi:hypothetical protein
MTEQGRGPRDQLKRTYERPRLEPSEVFGAEAASGSCCRGAACSNAIRNTQRTTIDPNKQKSSTAS